MTAPTTTALYASLSVLLLVALGGYTSTLRAKNNVLLGHNDIGPLQRVQRAHGNLAEYLGPFIGVLLFAELLGGNSVVLHSIGGSFLVARVCHAIGVIGRKLPLHSLGAGVNYLVLTFAAGYGLYLRFVIGA